MALSGELSDDVTHDISDNSIIPLAASSQRNIFTILSIFPAN